MDELLQFLVDLDDISKKNEQGIAQEGLITEAFAEFSN